MPETPVTPLRHVRGTSFDLSGFVKNNGAAQDITTWNLSFVIAFVNPDGTMTSVISRDQTSGDVARYATGRWTVTLASSVTKRTSLPEDDYWVQVNVTDPGTGKVWCVGRGPLELLASPQGES